MSDRISTLKNSQMFTKSTLGYSLPPPEDGKTVPVEQRLWTSGLSQQERLDSKKKIYQKLETEPCSFKPKLNKISEQIIKSKAEFVSSPVEEKHEFLFALSNLKDGKIKKLSDEYFRKTCPFAPTISEPPESIKKRLETETLFDRELRSHEMKKQWVDSQIQQS